MSIFSRNKMPRIKVSKYNWLWDNKLSLRMGALVPVMCEEVLPGDIWKGGSEMFLRFAPLLAPMMQRVNVYLHYFFVPNRIIWKPWEDFITGGKDGNTIYEKPWITAKKMLEFDGIEGVLTTGTLMDYLGLPTISKDTPSDNIDDSEPIDLLPFLAYQRIFYDWYIDQNLNGDYDELASLFPFEKEGPQDSASLPYSNVLKLQQRCWKKDYFTSALPFAQRGSEVSLPIGDKAPVQLTSDYKTGGVWKSTIPNENFGPLDELTNANLKSASSDGSQAHLVSTKDQSSYHLANVWDPKDTLEADLSNASPTTINTLRRAEKLQEWLERNARFGSRYIEQLAGQFGVISSDARLQRSRLLGGNRFPVTISEVLQTGQTTETSPQGNMAGHAMSAGTGKIRFKSEEHGFIFCIASVMPDASYFQGIPKKFSRMDKFDYAFPVFATLGEQEIQQKELYADFSKKGSIINKGFGYTPRYSEYKYKMSEVHGDFRDTLDFWHLGRKFTYAPTLNDTFVSCFPSDRIFAVQQDSSYGNLWSVVQHNFQVVRRLPKRVEPQLC